MAGARTRHSRVAAGEPDADLGDVLEFMRLIWGISHGLQSTSKRMEAVLGITGPQRLVLRIVGRLPGVSAGRLADVLQLHPSTLTGVLRRLERRHLIARRPGVTDRRQARLTLTTAGREVDRRHAGTVEAAVRGVLSHLPPHAIATAADVLRALQAALEAPGRAPRRNASARRQRSHRA